MESLSVVANKKLEFERQSSKRISGKLNEDQE